MIIFSIWESAIMEAIGVFGIVFFGLGGSIDSVNSLCLILLHFLTILIMTLIGHSISGS